MQDVYCKWGYGILGFTAPPSCCCCDCCCWRSLRFVALNSFRIWHSHYFMFYAATLLDSFGNPTELARHFYVLSRLHILCPSAFSEPLMCHWLPPACLPPCLAAPLLLEIYDPAQLRILQLWQFWRRFAISCPAKSSSSFATSSIFPGFITNAFGAALFLLSTLPPRTKGKVSTKFHLLSAAELHSIPVHGHK